VGELLGQSSEATVLEDAYVPRALVDDRRNLVHIEPAENTEQDHFGLISRQARTYKRDGCVSPEHVDGGHGWVVFGGMPAEDVRRHRNDASACFTPSPVDETVPGDGEHPRAELLVVAAKARQVASGDEPGVGLDVFCRYRIESAEEPKQPRMEVLPQDGDRPLGTLLGGQEHVAELGGRHVRR